MHSNHIGVNMLVYVDMAIAFPIALFALSIISLALIANSSLIISTSGSASRMLGIYSESQILVSTLYETNLNYSEAIALSSSFSRDYNVTVTITTYSDNVSCSYDAVCRIITLSGRLYMLEMK